MKYRTKQHAEQNPSIGEINDEPSMTIEGEYMEMKDILGYALKGGQIPKTDVQYFRPEEIQQINSLYKNSMDLTDIDKLRERTGRMKQAIDKATERKQKAQAELNEELKKQEQKTQPTE